VALRTDRAALRPPREGEVGLEAAVTLVEYQGTNVQIRFAAPAGRELQVLLDERAFDAAPVAKGERGPAELGARRGASPGRLISGTDQRTRARGRHEMASTTMYRVLDRSGGVSRRELLGTVAMGAPASPRRARWRHRSSTRPSRSRCATPARA
jgi:hypothetical protein